MGNDYGGMVMILSWTDEQKESQKELNKKLQDARKGK